MSLIMECELSSVVAVGGLSSCKIKVLPLMGIRLHSAIVNNATNV